MKLLGDIKPNTLNEDGKIIVQSPPQNYLVNEELVIAIDKPAFVEEYYFENSDVGLVYFSSKADESLEKLHKKFGQRLYVLGLHDLSKTHIYLLNTIKKFSMKEISNESKIEVCESESLNAL